MCNGGWCLPLSLYLWRFLPNHFLLFGVQLFWGTFFFASSVSLCPSHSFLPLPFIVFRIKKCYTKFWTMYKGISFCIVSFLALITYGPCVLSSFRLIPLSIFSMDSHPLSVTFSFSVSLSFSTLVVFKILWFVSLQTLINSRGKIRTGITSKHQHHFPSSSRSLSPLSLPSFPPSSDFISFLYVLHSHCLVSILLNKSFSFLFSFFFVSHLRFSVLFSSQPLS